MKAIKKLELAWQLNNYDKLGEANHMEFNYGWKECSPEERNEIYEIALSLEWMCRGNI